MLIYLNFFEVIFLQMVILHLKVTPSFTFQNLYDYLGIKT